MQYRREIDGLRAIAVLPVILFHAGFSWFSGGYVGVDVFFVISGYLITSILLNDLDKGTFSIVKFYERRARRILPALFFVMLCCMPFAWMWLAPQELKNFSQALVAISFFSSNILFWRKSGYFGPAAEENPLIHTWSLAVEEQFYIIFPIMLLLLWRFGKRPIFYIIVFLSFTSLALAEYGWRNHPSANFYLLPTRAWELGIGAICAFLLYHQPVRKSSTASLIGLGLIGCSIFLFDETTPFPSLYAIIPVIGTALVILYADNKSLAIRVISNKFFVGIGLISFSAYLWHQPLLAFARIRSEIEPSPLLMLGLSFVSLILAAFTWKYIEQPFRTKPNTFAKTRKQIFSYSALGTVLFFSTGIYGHLQDGLSSRSAPSGKTFAEINVSEKTRVNHGLNIDCEGEFTTSKNCRTGDNPTVMVWGDSFAMHLMQAVRASESLGGRDVIQFTKSSCAPVFGLAKVGRTKSWAEGCIKFNNQVKDWLSQNQTVEYVLLSSPMNIIHSRTLNEEGEFSEPSTKLTLNSANKVAEFIQSLGKKAIFISPPPTTGEDLSKCSSYNLIFGTGEDFGCEFAVDEVSQQYVEIMDFLKSENFKLPVIDLSSYICNDVTCETYISKINIYRDTGHLSHAGSQYIGAQYDLLGAAIKISNNAEQTDQRLSNGVE
jgi:peptidoglycan/LPS O-acetylase OafA/YrhL